MTTTNLFPNLFAAIKAERENQSTEFAKTVNSKTDLPYLLTWNYRELLPQSKKNKVWAIDELKAYLIEREQKRTAKSIEKQLQQLITVSSAPILKSIVVSIEWKKSRMWGNNPRAEAKVESDLNYSYYDSGSIGGCGYDKESTAIAHSVNQSNEFLKQLYLVREQELTMPNRELFGYGSGYGILPRLEGGVGISCYPAIFDKIGFTFKNTASGKTFDVYTIAIK